MKDLESLPQEARGRRENCFVFIDVPNNGRIWAWACCPLCRCESGVTPLSDQCWWEKQLEDGEEENNGASQRAQRAVAEWGAGLGASYP